MGVVLFGEVIQYRVPEVARDRHQALEQRWATGIWLGHARSSPEVLVATTEVVIKVWAIRRKPEGQQWDGEMIKNIKGSPKYWKIDMCPDPDLVEQGDQDDLDEDPPVALPSGHRRGEKRSMYLTRRDFARYGFTDGCVGCMDIASGRTGPIGCLAPHTVACRRRMEAAIQEAEPDRWAEYLRKRGDVPEERSERVHAVSSSTAGGKMSNGPQCRHGTWIGCVLGICSCFEAGSLEAGRLQSTCSLQDGSELDGPPHLALQLVNGGSSRPS